MMNKTWKDNSIQFPRLLSEINGVMEPKQFKELQENMDLSKEELNELFDRAEAEWYLHKQKIFGKESYPDEYRINVGG